MKNAGRFAGRRAFLIDGKSWTYDSFAGIIHGIQKRLLSTVERDNRRIGIYTFDDIYTYASIYACWFSGKTMIPLNPANPPGRNRNILEQTGINTLLSSKNPSLMDVPGSDIRWIMTGDCEPSGGLPAKEDQDPGQDYYILFTSGSSGVPKGVRITGDNLNAFVNDFIGSGYVLDENDRFLQIYDLTFDASVHCYTVPLSIGASVHTVNPGSIKYLQAYKLMKEQALSFAKMPPSTLSYLKPWFGNIRLESLRYCLLGGEAFPENLAGEWEPCVPNAKIQNVYGPTEATINCLIYDWNQNEKGGKSHKGIVSVGRCFGRNRRMIVDESLREVAPGETGELCIGGPQVTPGYWKNKEKNREAFFESGGVRFYRTGDLVHEDADGDVMFTGRKDFQVQINGYRVELSEIEMHARNLPETGNVLAAGIQSREGTTELCLFTELPEAREEELREYLRQQLPEYMVPRYIVSLKELPKTAGGKINRSELIKNFPYDKD